jgi:UDP-N-acetylenolpyruvoylglucosamine reductase
VDALVLRLQHPCWRRISVARDGRVRVGAGVRLRQLCGEACRQGMAGLEFLEGIPGTVGGALRMNAGAMGGWIFDLVQEVRLMSWDGDERTLRREEMHYGYRNCRELAQAIALEAVLAAPGREAVEEIKHRLKEYQARRNESQPRESSAGCMFKNPDGDHAGRLIDELGLKGARVGDAEVSAVHANFIVNRGRATAGDVIGLVRLIRREVRRQKAVELEPEALLFGKDWREVL